MAVLFNTGTIAVWALLCTVQVEWCVFWLICSRMHLIFSSLMCCMPQWIIGQVSSNTYFSASRFDVFYVLFMLMLCVLFCRYIHLHS